MAPWRLHPCRAGCILYLICNQMLGTCRFQWLVLTLLHVTFYPSSHSALFVPSSLFSTRGEASVPLESCLLRVSPLCGWSQASSSYGQF
ncbi:hypothetical protein F4821DRAFT_197100 [Hypoxylon rubiginosum]|uniref:Uncharacterized protein n=1 Tax=Hypoxylon rubiginosum TaxID=110542 RepID=A0ACC0CRW9_9PEZI|nr:hypothetical protein F4821DRAFT_197100 [Hypoxylon rubiginosum]